MILNENVQKKIIPVAGGKGGVGKSIFSVNLAITLAASGKKVLLIDLDLGGSNLHTLLGIKNTNFGVGHYFYNKKLLFKELILETAYDNLYFIPGDVHVFGSNEISFQQIKRLLKIIPEQSADFIILDLGAGSSQMTLDFFLISNSGIIVTTPQNTAIANAHLFLKNLVLRFLQRAFDNDPHISQFLKRVFKETKPGDLRDINDILDEMRRMNEQAADKAEIFLEVLQPKIIINMVESPQDNQVGETLSQLVRKHYRLNLECLGLIMYDKAINNSIQDKEPFVLKYPETIVAMELNRIAQKILQSERFPQMPYDLNLYKDSFELAEIEAEYDLEVMRDQQSEWLQSDGSYDVEKMLNTISGLQERISLLERKLRYHD
jgi:flagellar biosynthesis protein FlhG